MNSELRTFLNKETDKQTDRQTETEKERDVIN